MNAIVIHVAMSQLQSLFTASVVACDIAVESAVSLCERALRALIYKTEKSAVNNIHGSHIFELTKFHDCLSNERRSDQNCTRNSARVTFFCRSKIRPCAVISNQISSKFTREEVYYLF